MQVTETLNDGLKRGYDITISASELDAKVNEKLVEARPEIEMKGFRKGKVPMALLKKQYGQRLLGEAMQEAVDGAMAEHFEKTGDRPALQPQVKMKGVDWKEGDDVEVWLAPLDARECHVVEALVSEHLIVMPSVGREAWRAATSGGKHVSTPARCAPRRWARGSRWSARPG